MFRRQLILVCETVPQLSARPNGPNRITTNQIAGALLAHARRAPTTEARPRMKHHSLRLGDIKALRFSIIY
jgi:hypothetical protein